MALKFYFIIVILISLQCSIGPGTSGRDVCKDGDGKAVLHPNPSRTERFELCSRVLFFNQSTGVDSKAFSDLILIQCAASFVELKKCDSKSRNPWPIPD